MIIIPVAPPQAVQAFSGFDYVTVDPQRRRVYAAHTGANRLLIVDADSGKTIAQVKVGPLHGVAFDPRSGAVFTGDGTARTISKIDPVTFGVTAAAEVAGPIDAIAYDPATHRIYADEDSGTHVYVIDAVTMKSVGTVLLPGHDEEFLAVDPVTHVVYQNIPDKNEFVEIDPITLTVVKVVPTPLLRENHPLQYDARHEHVIVGGKNGVLAVYTPSGKLVARAALQPDVDQCSLERASSQLACAGNGIISVYRLGANGPPVREAQIDLHEDIHTIGIDPKTHALWVVWAGKNGDRVQRLRVSP